MEGVTNIVNKVEGAVEDVLGVAAVDLAKVGETLGLANLDPSSGTIFVTGGTGVLGHRVAMRLLNAGYPTLRVGCHQPNEELSKMGAEVADFDWSNDATYEHALKGVKSVLCTAPYMLNWEDQFPVFLQACKKAGVKHFVKLSFYHARRAGDPFQDVPLVKAHGFCDNMLVKSGVGYTILSATHLMSNPLVFQGKNLRANVKPATFYGSSNNKCVNYVSPNDVAEVAVRVLLEPKAHFDKEYTLTGPAAITDQHVSELLGKHLQKPVMFVDQPLHTYEDGEKLGGDPEWLVADLVALEKIKASGVEEAEGFQTKVVEGICGRPAETYEDYLDHTEYMTAAEKA